MSEVINGVIVLRVASDSNPNSVAGSIARNIAEGTSVEVLAVGASAINQAVKALAIARGYAAPTGKDLLFKPGFHMLDIGGEEKTGIKFFVVVR